MRSIRFTRSSLTLVALAALVALPASRLDAQHHESGDEGQRTQIRGFMDLQARTGDDTTSSDGFSLGQFDLYITSQISDRISFLGETVFEYDEDFVVDVERVLVTFSPRDALQLSVGKGHTPIGFWNTAYHHGALLQPTISRPLMFRFEDEGGVLPVHTIGALLFGRDIGPLHLGYDVMVGNGTGSSPEGDNDGAKSLTMALKSELRSDLQVGVSAYADDITAGTETLAGATLADRMTQRAVGGFVSYLGARGELIGEYQRVQNRLDGASSSANDAWYAYAGWRLGRLVPYLRVDQLAFDDTDPWFAPDDVRMELLGARYDFSAAAQAKLELQHRDDDTFGKSTQLVAQVAIGF